MYKPIPGRFKDYIAMPKQNMYQSLHTTLIGPEGHPFEIQIRTFEMHRIAEYGIAAHWKYKKKQQRGRQQRRGKAELASGDPRVAAGQDDNKSFCLSSRRIWTCLRSRFTVLPQNGDVKSLANGSTPIDFAYSIHSAVGNTMVGARVNGRQVPFEYHLQNGDRVEVITSQNSKGPSRDWLNIVKSTQAKSKINQWFKTQFKEENIVKGKEILRSTAGARELNCQAT